MLSNGLTTFVAVRVGKQTNASNPDLTNSANIGDAKTAFEKVSS
jgi:hypothetical protein